MWKKSKLLLLLLFTDTRHGTTITHIQYLYHSRGTKSFEIVRELFYVCCVCVCVFLTSKRKILEAKHVTANELNELTKERNEQILLRDQFFSVVFFASSEYVAVNMLRQKKKQKKMKYSLYTYMQASQTDNKYAINKLFYSFKSFFFFTFYAISVIVFIYCFILLRLFFSVIII